MNRVLLKKAFGEGKYLFISLASVLFAFSWIRVRIVAQIETSRFEAILSNLPEKIDRLLPVPIEQFITYPARISAAFEEPIAYMVMAIWCFARSSDIVSGELGRGSMEMLLSQPVRRREVLWTHVSVVLVGVAALALIALGGSYLGILTTSVEVEQNSTVTLLGVQIPWVASTEEPEKVPLRELMDWLLLLPAVLNYLSLGVFLTGLTTMLSAFDRYRWRTIGFSVGFYVIQTVFELLGLAFEPLSWLRYLTFFTAYEPVRFVADAHSLGESPWTVFSSTQGTLEFGPLGYDLVLIGLGDGGDGGRLAGVLQERFACSDLENYVAKHDAKRSISCAATSISYPFK